MINATTEIWHVRLGDGGLRQARLACPLDEHDQEHAETCPSQLARRKDAPPELRKVQLHSAPGDFDDLLRECDASVPIGVFTLDDSPKGLVVRELAALRAKQLVLRATGVGTTAGKEQRYAAAAEERVLQQHAFLVAHIKVRRDHLRRNDQGARTPIVLEQLPGEVYRDDVRGAAHAAEVVATHVVAQAEAVADHRAERRRGREEGTIHDEYVDVPRLEARLLEDVLHDGEDHCLGLLLREGPVHNRLCHPI
mmetsp:Transcript_102561/g.289692  ORF Transcript_102561/g.289692 Transcript_102561/m.289692 type:complete len:252 (-) Transcript_102561:541-1296(-)